MSYFVRIDGVEDDLLEFLGYSLSHAEDRWKLYVDCYGSMHIVDIKKPSLYVEDMNDANILASRAQVQEVTTAPQKDGD